MKGIDDAMNVLLAKAVLVPMLDETLRCVDQEHALARRSVSLSSTTMHAGMPVP